MKHEFEIIQHTELEYVKAFLLEITTRSYHGHNDIEIGLILNGSISINQGGEKSLLKEGDLFLLNSNDIHSFEKTNEQNLILAIQISPRLTHRYHSALSNTHFDITLLNEHLKDEQSLLFRSLLLEFTYSYYQKSNFYELRCMTLLHMLLYQLHLNCPHHSINDKALSTKAAQSRRLNRLIQTIDENYNQSISLLDLATQEGLSVTYVSHFIKDNLGISFQTYLNNLRFEHASFLLLNSDLSILTICIETGISSSRYLNKMFLDRYQCTAREFKKSEKRQKKEKHSHIHPGSPDTLEKHFQSFDTLKTLLKYREALSPSYRALFFDFLVTSTD